MSGDFLQDRGGVIDPMVRQQIPYAELLESQAGLLPSEFNENTEILRKQAMYFGWVPTRTLCFRAGLMVTSTTRLPKWNRLLNEPASSPTNG